MDSLYELLESISAKEDRQRAIRDYLSSHDLTRFLSENFELTDEIRIPYQDNKTSFNFIVGNKYLRDEPYSIEDSPVYILGIVRSGKSAELFVAQPDEGEQFACISRECMEPPEVMLKQQKKFFVPGPYTEEK